MYKRLLLTYIDKYERLDMSVLSKELSMTEHQIADMAYSLKERGYIEIKQDKYYVTGKGKEWIFPFWNDWSRYRKSDKNKTDGAFEWDYLYIPENMV